MRWGLLVAVVVANVGLAQDAGVPAPGPTTGALVLEVKGFKSDAGHAWVLVYDRAETFPRKRELAVVNRFEPIRDGKLSTVVEGLGPGEYAVAVIHDENGNGKLDTNFLRIPNEGLGSSRDAPARFGPPSWKDAKVRLNAGTRLELAISMRY